MAFKVDITITNPDGQKATISGAFDFVAAPSIAGITPTSGPISGGTAVTITGANFLPGAMVKFGDKTATNVAVSADGKSITATTPALG